MIRTRVPLIRSDPLPAHPVTMANALPHSIQVEPLFYGAGPKNSAQSGATTPEQFLAYIEHTKVVGNLSDQQAIHRATLLFRGEASSWWTFFVKVPTSGLDYARLTTNWDYFCERFKKHFFTVRDNRDTVSNITDIKQKSDESILQFFTRLASALQQQSELSTDYTNSAADALDYSSVVPQAFRDFLDNPSGNAALTAAQAKEHFETCARALLKQGVRLRRDHEFYENVARTAAANAADPKMKLFLRKKIFEADRSLETLMDMAVTEEKAHRKLPEYDTAAVDGEHNTTEEPEEDTDDQLAAAIGQQGRGRGRPQQFRGGGRGSGANRGGPQRGKGRGRQPPYIKGQNGCDHCKVGTHQTKDCRQLQRLCSQHFGLPAPQKQLPPPQLQQQQQPTCIPCQPRQLPSRQPASLGQPEPMDTSYAAPHMGSVACPTGQPIDSLAPYASGHHMPNQCFH